jgi:hypothetical protein
MQVGRALRKQYLGKLVSSEIISSNFDEQPCARLIDGADTTSGEDFDFCI